MDLITGHLIEDIQFSVGAQDQGFAAGTPAQRTEPVADRLGELDDLHLIGGGIDQSELVRPLHLSVRVDLHVGQHDRRIIMSANVARPTVRGRAGNLGERPVGEGQDPVLATEHDHLIGGHRLAVDTGAVFAAGDLAVALHRHRAGTAIRVAEAVHQCPVRQNHRDPVMRLWRGEGAAVGKSALFERVRIECGDLTRTVGEQHGVLAMHDDVARVGGGEGVVGHFAARRIENSEALVCGHEHVRLVTGRIDPQESVERDVLGDFERLTVEDVETSVVRRHQRLGDRFGRRLRCRCRLRALSALGAVGSRRARHQGCRRAGQRSGAVQPPRIEHICSLPS